MARLIKRYENRKLYDTEAKRYISLGDIREMVRQGMAVQVIDNVSGEDITTQTLTQVILEEGKRGRSLLPSDILHHVIRWGSEFFEDGLKQIRARVEKMVTEPLQNLVKDEPGDLEKISRRIDDLTGVIQRLEEDIDRWQKEQ